MGPAMVEFVRNNKKLPDDTKKQIDKIVRKLSSTLVDGNTNRSLEMKQTKLLSQANAKFQALVSNDNNRNDYELENKEGQKGVISIISHE